jgi:lysophospholipase L1-like esterase
MPRLLAGFFVLIVALALAACGGDEDSAAGRAPSETADSIASTTAPAGGQTETATPTPSDGNAIIIPPVTGARPLYLSIGDSLAAGIGATTPVTGGWAPLVAASFENFDFVNLGIPGDDSDELLNDGQLDDALLEIADRGTDDDPDNDVGAITLEIGGNDLLDIYFDLVIPGDCPNLVEALQRDVCVNALSDALTEYRANLRETLTRLQAATEAPIFLMTLYNPFSGGASTLDEIGQLALEGQADTPFPNGLNDAIREIGSEFGVEMVEWYEPFLGKQSEYISMDLIHPNDTGHRVMADAVIAAMAQAGLPVVD